jgi:iron complex outermembrane receptor protein
MAALLIATQALGQTTESITVRSSPLDSPVSDLAQPVAVLDSDGLRRRRATSLGDTLAQELGVHSTAFGPGAGRPIIRGMDGARVRVLENGTGTLDVSSLSPDHQVTSETLRARRIEILRGPATLLYGSGAAGGVVNVLSERIPRIPQVGFSGDAELRAASGTGERTLSANLGGGAGRVAWRVDGFSRNADDYRIPARARQDDAQSATGRLPDSKIDSEGAGAGVALVSGQGHLGLGGESLRSVYGIPSGEGARIDLRQHRQELSGELTDPLPGFGRARARAAFNDYRHAEIAADGKTGTRFTNRAQEGRMELQHRPLAGWHGALGVQLQGRRFAALGEEAVVPPTRARALGIFIVEQKAFGDVLASGGLRWERETMRPDVDAPARTFTPGTVALGMVWRWRDDLRLSANLTRAERAPAIEELYSNGPHAATATFDIGDPALGKEVANNLDFSLAGEHNVWQWKASLFVNRVRKYIHPASVDRDGNGMADRVSAEGEFTEDREFLVQTLRAGNARFVGAEAEVTWRPTPDGSWLRLFCDRVRAQLRPGGNLPRISPARLGAEAGWVRGAWQSTLSVLRVQRQDQVAALETATPGYTRVDAELTHRWKRAPWDLTTFVQARNLLDRDIRIHTSYLKDTAPAAGRTWTLGMRARF